MRARVFIFASVLGCAAAQDRICDRSCLESFVDQYMDALIAHNPRQLPMTKGVKNTEDGVRLEPGDGFWRTALAKGTYRLLVSDPEAGQVAFLGTMQEGRAPMPKPVAFAVRLKIENRQVSEIETFVVRNNQAGGNLERLGRPHPVFLTAIPAAQRQSRAELVSIANLYLSGLEKNDGKLTAPFADDCQRVQNGNQTTNNAPAGAQMTQLVNGGAGGGKQEPRTGQINIAAMGCLEQVKLGYFNYIQRIRDRRFVVVDRERGLTLAIAEMDEPAGEYATFKLADGREITAGPDWPRSIALFEVYKIEGGQIRRVEAVQHDVPYGMLSGWSSYEEGMSSKARTR